MKSKTSKLMIGIIFLAGLSLLLYPFVANQWNNYRQKQLISSYEQTVSQKEASNGIDYDAELKKAEAYNEAFLFRLSAVSHRLQPALPEKLPLHLSSVLL